MDISAGPLTTTYTPATSCLTDVYRFNASYTYTEDSQVKTYQYTNLGPTTTANCLPSGFAPVSVYYSPGICPSGYGQACSSVASIGNSVETRATCCPLGYACQTETQDPWPWYSTEKCTIAFFGAGTETLHITSSISPDLTTTFTTTMNGGLNAYGISIRYQAADFATTTTTSSSSSSSSTVSSSTVTSPPSILSPASSTFTASITSKPSTISSTSLSGGTIAGIVIGVVALLALLSGLIIFIRRSKRRQPRPYLPEPVGGPMQDHYLYGNSGQMSQGPPKYQHRIVEMGDGGPTHELPAGAALSPALQVNDHSMG